MTGISQKTTYKLRKEISEKINRLPMSYFDKKTNGETLSLITNDVDTFSQNMDQSITQLITSIIMIYCMLKSKRPCSAIRTSISLHVGLGAFAIE